VADRTRRAEWTWTYCSRGTMAFAGAHSRAEIILVLTVPPSRPSGSIVSASSPTSCASPAPRITPEEVGLLSSGHRRPSGCGERSRPRWRPSASTGTSAWSSGALSGHRLPALRVGVEISGVKQGPAARPRPRRSSRLGRRRSQGSDECFGSLTVAAQQIQGRTLVSVVEGSKNATVLVEDLCREHLLVLLQPHPAI
jgi:hypothetical protein